MTENISSQSAVAFDDILQREIISRKRTNIYWLDETGYQHPLVKARQIENEKQAGEQLLKLSHLPSDWDSYGAIQIDETCIFKVFEFLNILFKFDISCPWIVPINNGMIQLEWHSDTGDLEIEFLNLEVIEIYYKERDKNISKIKQRCSNMNYNLLISFIKSLGKSQLEL